MSSFPGGIHPRYEKEITSGKAIRELDPPAEVVIPLCQHIGAPATPAVRRGERVAKGQLLAHSQGMISAPVHAPTSGRIVGIGSYPAHQWIDDVKLWDGKPE